MQVLLERYGVNKPFFLNTETGEVTCGLLNNGGCREIYSFSGVGGADARLLCDAVFGARVCSEGIDPNSILVLSAFGDCTPLSQLISTWRDHDIGLNPVCGVPKSS